MVTLTHLLKSYNDWTLHRCILVPYDSDFFFQRATETLLCGKSALVCGYGEVGKGIVSALKSLGCILFVSEADPICALQVME